MRAEDVVIVAARRDRLGRRGVESAVPGLLAEDELDVETLLERTVAAPVRLIDDVADIVLRFVQLDGLGLLGGEEGDLISAVIERLGKRVEELCLGLRFLFRGGRGIGSGVLRRGLRVVLRVRTGRKGQQQGECEEQSEGSAEGLLFHHNLRLKNIYKSIIQHFHVKCKRFLIFRPADEKKKKPEGSFRLFSQPKRRTKISDISPRERT